jgi:hypothetical protein
MAIPSGCDYELMRKQRIEDNRRRMGGWLMALRMHSYDTNPRGHIDNSLVLFAEDMGLLKQKTILDSFRVVKRAPSGEEGVKKTYIRKVGLRGNSGQTTTPRATQC